MTIYTLKKNFYRFRNSIISAVRSIKTYVEYTKAEKLRKKIKVGSRVIEKSIDEKLTELGVSESMIISNNPIKLNPLPEHLIIKAMDYSDELIPRNVTAKKKQKKEYGKSSKFF